MKPKDDFEYGGLWLHASEKRSLKWRRKGNLLVPPIEDFHKQLILTLHQKFFKRNENEP